MTRRRAVRVFVSGPLTRGDPFDNTLTALTVGSRLLDAGLAPYVPHLSYYWNEWTPRSYETWMTLDFEWLGACDIVLRIPGESPGAEREVARAEALGIPVYYDVDYLIKELGNGHVITA